LESINKCRYYRNGRHFVKNLRARSTAEGQKKGRGRRHFFEEASRVNPEVEDRDRTYLERILKMLDAGDLMD